MSLAMTPREREAFLAEVHVGVISIPEPGRGPLAVPIWSSVQRETPPYKYVSVEGPIVACAPSAG
jgi:hypothetical protein